MAIEPGTSQRLLTFDSFLPAKAEEGVEDWKAEL